MLGAGGCALTAPLASMRTAFARSDTEDDADVGFFRALADPYVVIVTGGYDCSVTSAGADAFDPDGDRAAWLDPEAEAPTPAACLAVGTACEPTDDGDLSCRASDLDAAGEPLRGDASPMLRPVAQFREEFDDVIAARQWVRPDAQGFVLVLAGVQPANEGLGAGPYEVPADPAQADATGFRPICEAGSDPVYPAVRLLAFTDPLTWHYGPQPYTLASACEADYAPALLQLAAQIEDTLQPACLWACVADVDDDVPGVQPACEVWAEVIDPQRGTITTDVMPPCLGRPDDPLVPAGEAGCYVTHTGDDLAPACAEAGLNLELSLYYDAPASTVSVQADCERSADWRADCPNLN
jgi:hypothetical protein